MPGYAMLPSCGLTRWATRSIPIVRTNYTSRYYTN